MRPEGRAWLPLLGGVVGLLAGCAQPYARVVVAGVLVPITAPVPRAGTTLVPLPPLPGVPADTTDGATLVAIDERACLRATGWALPAWAPTPSPHAAVDPLLERLSAIVADLTAILRQVDEPHPASPTPSAGSPATVDSPSTLPAAAIRGDWAAAAARLLALAQAIDALRTVASTEATPGGPIDPRDGAAVLQARQAALWEGMAPRAQALAEAVDALLGTPVLARPAAASARAALRDAAADVLASVHDHLASTLVAPLRVLQARLDAVDALPAVGEEGTLRRAHAEGAPSVPPWTARARIVVVRRALVALAAQWSRNQATLLVPQPTPLLVYERPVVVPSVPEATLPTRGPSGSIAEPER